MKKDKFITEKYLDKTLDRKFGEHSKIIVAAVDNVLSKRIKEAKEELKKDINSV